MIYIFTLPVILGNRCSFSLKKKMRDKCIFHLIVTYSINHLSGNLTVYRTQLIPGRIYIISPIQFGDIFRDQIVKCLALDKTV